jgi:8-oxo-dGTP pyrophosphatase MutT (NUDIX family)
MTAPGPRRWACLEAVRHFDPSRRVPVWLQHGTRPAARVGCVAVEHLADLMAALPRLQVDAVQAPGRGLTLRCGPGGLSALASPLATLHRQMHHDGRLRGWRGESYALSDLDAHPPGTPLPAVLVPIERAASRFWGSLTLGAHCNGYVADAAGRPTHLWVARRSLRKPTDPGRLDNLIGGGVPIGQTPFEALVREGWEEAGLPAETLRQARAGGVYALLADIPDGFQREHLHVHDLALPAGQVPVNQDGEVDEFVCLPLEAALDLAAGTEMTVHAALSTLDFALRHRLLAPAEHARLDAIAAALREPVVTDPHG